MQIYSTLPKPCSWRVFAAPNNIITVGFVLTFIAVLLIGCSPRLSKTVRKKDRNKDIEMVTDLGTMRLRLSDSTPLHRDNFIRLVRSGFYQGISFHRVIQGFMVQAGDPRTKPTKDSSFKSIARIPAEIRPEMFHKKGVLAAAREGDASNPQRASSYSQFYLVQGRVFTDFSLDSTETYRLKGRKLPAAHREVYKTLGGAPHLDQNYTVFGEVISG
ncbi:MAG: peptidylprolyl isomerase [Chitinophagaceae bacterium]|nr:MAG: peptidylprolyl isomerase [Chitinophagaceae bacterium]